MNIIRNIMRIYSQPLNIRMIIFINLLKVKIIMECKVALKQTPHSPRIKIHSPMQASDTLYTYAN